MDIAKLKTELTDDPLARGYSGMSDEAAAIDLNSHMVNRNRTSMTGRQVADEIVDGEYDTLTDPEKAQVLALIASQDIDPFGFAANVVKDIFGAGSGTVAALAAARVESVSRAVYLDLDWVRTGNVTEARS